MLKACWDCLGGKNEIVKTQQNGNSIQVREYTSPLPRWSRPKEKSEIMFILPQKLFSGDQITVYGTMRSNPNILTANLITGSVAPDYQNIACQLVATFPTDISNENQVTISIIQNGQQEIISGDYQSIPATELFTDLSFKFGFTIVMNGGYTNEPILDIYVGESFLDQVKLKHNMDEIRFLSLNGDILKIEKLEFQFA